MNMLLVLPFVARGLTAEGVVVVAVAVVVAVVALADP